VYHGTIRSQVFKSRSSLKLPDVNVKLCQDEWMDGIANGHIDQYRSIERVSKYYYLVRV